MRFDVKKVRRPEATRRVDQGDMVGPHSSVRRSWIARMPHSILVVEDHEPFRRFIRASLAARAETRTFEVSDGPAAIEQAAALQPDVILLDIGLPGLNGL